MGRNKGELAYFIAEAPEYEARGDYIVGKRDGMEFVFTVPTAQQIILRLREAIAKARLTTLDRGNVIGFRPRH